MRNSGERGERQRGALPDALARAGAEALGRRQTAPANGGASLFTPAYRVSHAEDANRPGPPTRDGWDQERQPRQGDTPDRDPTWSDEPGWRFGDEPGWPGSSGPDPRASNAVRGFPPAPGEPLPVYPPGPFAAWNQRGTDLGQDEPTRRADRSRQLAAASITPVEFDTDFSLPAIKDPILTSGQAQATGRDTRAVAARRTARPADHGGTRRKPRPRTRSQPVRFAIAAAGLIIVAVALILVITSPGHSGPPSANHPSSKPSTPNGSPSRPPGKWGFIALQSTDATPVTGAELFPVRFATAGITYARVAMAGGPHCRAALIGTTLQSAVHKAGCTQAVRATFVSHQLKMMATIGVFNLKSAATAGTAAKAAGGSQFVAQLKSKKGLAHRIGQGTGIEVAAVEGHYLLLGWAEYTGLSAPKTHTQRLQLENFITVVIRNTASLALSYRMTNGKPLPPG